MTSTLVLCALMIGAFLWFTRGSKTRGSVVPPTAAEREWLWRQRLDQVIGGDSEERLRLAAKGAAARRRMLAEIRNIEQRKAAEAEAKAAAAANADGKPVPVVVVRRKLSMVR
jgi:hypothetical protein